MSYLTNFIIILLKFLNKIFPKQSLFLDNYYSIINNFDKNNYFYYFNYIIFILFIRFNIKLKKIVSFILCFLHFFLKKGFNFYLFLYFIFYILYILFKFLRVIEYRSNWYLSYRPFSIISLLGIFCSNV